MNKQKTQIQQIKYRPMWTNNDPLKLSKYIPISGS